MTDHDLATLLRRHVADEPPFDAPAGVVLGRGRRAVRRTRAVIAVAGAAGLALAVALVVPPLAGGESGPDRVVDPVIAEAIDAYDVTTMPRTMDGRARAILETSVPDLGPAAFVAFDSQGQELPERYWPKASGLTVRYGDGTPHRLSVTLNHARGEAEGVADRYCDGGLEGGWFIECRVERDAGDATAISTLGAVRLDRPAGPGLQEWRDQFMAVAEDELASVPPDQLWFSRDVKVVKSETFVTYVSEMVQAPDLASARERFLVPVDDLVALGLDPVLVMPKPPPGENGCPQWTMPTMDVSCSSTGQG